MTDTPGDDTDTPEDLARLREPFPPERVGKLPRITCPACSKAPGRLCGEHKKEKCGTCDNWITTRHIHLDYVGHGAVTERLLEVDPFWNWEPVAMDDKGMPAFVHDRDGRPVAFWIRLSVSGVRRLGVGTCDGGQHDAEKVLIGDALRNAAMRFGVALDLWIKGQGEDDERATATSERNAPGRLLPGPPPDPSGDTRPAPPDGYLHANEAKWFAAEAARPVPGSEGIPTVEDKGLAEQAWLAVGLKDREYVTPEEMTKAATLAKLYREREQEGGDADAPDDDGEPEDDEADPDDAY